MKERLDVLLVEQGFAVSREKAKAIIMSGNVFVNGQREDKAGKKETIYCQKKGKTSNRGSRAYIIKRSRSNDLLLLPKSYFSESIAPRNSFKRETSTSGSIP